MGVITALLVVQTSVGGSLKAALDRLWGTIAGALYGAIVAIIIPHVTDVGLGIAIAVAILPLAYLAAINPMFRVAPVTALIVMLPIYGYAGNPLASAFDRVIEITIGNIVALAVAFVILPTRAHSQLREAAAKVASLNADLMDRLIDGLTNDLGRQGVPPLHARIRAALKLAETAADEAARERKMKVSDERDPEPVIRTLYRVRHDLVMVGRAAVKPLPEAIIAGFTPLLVALRSDAGAMLRGISTSLVNRTDAPTSTAIRRVYGLCASRRRLRRGPEAPAARRPGAALHLALRARAAWRGYARPRLTNQRNGKRIIRVRSASRSRRLIEERRPAPQPRNRGPPAAAGPETVTAPMMPAPSTWMGKLPPCGA